MRNIRLITACLLAGVLAACGGGSTSSSAPTTPPAGTGGVTATVHYEHPIYTGANALTFISGILDQHVVSPIVSFTNGATTLWGTTDGTSSSATGTFPAGTYTMTAYAMTGLDHANPFCVVKDNTHGNAIYNVTQSVLIRGNQNNLFDVYPPRNFDGTLWTGPNLESPFAICDMVNSMGGAAYNLFGITPAPITIYWSETNTPTAGDVALGQIGDSHYANDAIYLLGDYSVQADEFNGSVIAKLYAQHLLEHAMRNDTLPGSYGWEDTADQRAAFYEGLSMVIGSALVDSKIFSRNTGPGLTSYAQVDLSMDNVVGSITSATPNIPVDGSYDPLAIAESLWQVFNPRGPSGYGGPLTMPAWQVLSVDMANRHSFNTIASFTALLSARVSATNPGDLSTLVSKLATEHISITDEWTDADSGMYTTVNVGAITSLDYAGAPLSTHTYYGPITNTSSGNMYLNHALLHAVTATAGNCHSLNIAPSTLTTVVVSGTDGVKHTSVAPGNQVSVKFIPGVNDNAFDVGSLGGSTNFSVTLTDLGFTTCL